MRVYGEEGHPRDLAPNRCNRSELPCRDPGAKSVLVATQPRELPRGRVEGGVAGTHDGPCEHHRIRGEEVTLAHNHEHPARSGEHMGLRSGDAAPILRRRQGLDGRDGERCGTHAHSGHQRELKRQPAVVVPVGVGGGVRILVLFHGRGGDHHTPDEVCPGLPVEDRGSCEGVQVGGLDDGDVPGDHPAHTSLELRTRGHQDAVVPPDRSVSRGIVHPVGDRDHGADRSGSVLARRRDCREGDVRAHDRGIPPSLKGHDLQERRAEDERPHLVRGGQGTPREECEGHTPVHRSNVIQRAVNRHRQPCERVVHLGGTATGFQGALQRVSATGEGSPGPCRAVVHGTNQGQPVRRDVVRPGAFSIQVHREVHRAQDGDPGGGGCTSPVGREVEEGDVRGDGENLVGEVEGSSGREGCPSVPRHTEPAQQDVRVLREQLKDDVGSRDEHPRGGHHLEDHLGLLVRSREERVESPLRRDQTATAKVVVKHQLRNPYEGEGGDHRPRDSRILLDGKAREMGCIFVGLHVLDRQRQVMPGVGLRHETRGLDDRGRPVADGAHRVDSHAPIREGVQGVLLDKQKVIGDYGAHSRVACEHRVQDGGAQHHRWIRGVRRHLPIVGQHLVRVDGFHGVRRVPRRRGVVRHRVHRVLGDQFNPKGECVAQDGKLRRGDSVVGEGVVPRIQEREAPEGGDVGRNGVRVLERDLSLEGGHRERGLLARDLLDPDDERVTPRRQRGVYQGSRAAIEAHVSPHPIPRNGLGVRPKFLGGGRIRHA